MPFIDEILNLSSYKYLLISCNSDCSFSYLTMHRLQSKPISTTYCVQAAGDVFIFTLDSITKKCVLAQRKKSDVVV